MSLPSVWEPRKLYKQNFLVSTMLRKSSKTRKEKALLLVPTRGTRMIIDYLKVKILFFFKCLLLQFVLESLEFFSSRSIKSFESVFFLKLILFKILFDFVFNLWSFPPSKKICDHSVHEVLFRWYLTTIEQLWR